MSIKRNFLQTSGTKKLKELKNLLIPTKEFK